MAGVKRNYLYTESAGSGDEYAIKEAGDFDYTPGAIPYETTLYTGTHRMIAGGADRVPFGVPVATNTLVGRTSGDISALSATDVRGVIDVQESANAAAGQNTAAGDTLTKTVQLYKDATGTFAERLNFRVMRPKSLNNVHLANLGDIIEVDSLVLPSVYAIHGDANINTTKRVPLMRSAQRMDLREVIVCPYFNTTPTGQEGLSFALYKLATPDEAFTIDNRWIDSTGYALRVPHLDAEGLGYIDKDDGRWKVPDDGSRSMNTGDWIVIQITQKFISSGVQNADIEYVTFTCRFGYI